MSSFEPIAPGGASAPAGDFVATPWAGAVGFAGAGLSRAEQGQQQAHEQLVQLDAALRLARAQGFDEAQAQSREPLRAALAALAELRSDYLVRSREGIVELALAIAERLVRHTLAERAEELAAFVEHAVASVVAEGPLRVRLAPLDAERLLGAVGQEGAEIGYEVVPDRDLRRGDVRVESATSELDARIETLLGIVRASLLPVDATPLEGGGER